MASELILIKFGGSLITDKNRPFSKNLRVIKRLCNELHEARKRLKNISIIVGNGGGSFAHPVAKKYGYTPVGIARVQDACAQLNRIIVGELLKVGENAFSISPSSMMVSQGKSIKKAFLEPLIRLLDMRILPVVYGDVVLGEKTPADLSTEKILSYLALNLQKSFRTKKIIHVGKTSGVYDDHGATIEKISKDNFGKVKDFIRGSDGIDVTGGMLHKVEESLNIGRFGIKTLIINGTLKGQLNKALLGRECQSTLIF